VDLIVLAKEPVPGRVKTRLCPPCTPAFAAEIAAAALADTLAAACASGADRVVLALDGKRGSWCPSDVVVVDQGDGDLDRRLTRAWEATNGPAVQIGMDTPQLTAADLELTMERLLVSGIDAVLGEAADGGWWAIGLRRPHPGAFVGVPTGRPDTGRRQLDRLGDLGLRVDRLPVRTDVDTWPDALAIALANPGTHFAAVVSRQLAALTPTSPTTGSADGRIAP
jgi:uncharacterized protein